MSARFSKEATEAGDVQTNTGGADADKPAAPEGAQAADVQAPAVSDGEQPEEDADAVDVVKVIVVLTITGTRNGQRWPAPGEEFVLPAAEAAEYLALGYVKPAE